MEGSSVFVVPVHVLGQLGPLQQLLLESDVIMDMTESIFLPTSHLHTSHLFPPLAKAGFGLVPREGLCR